MSDRIKEIQKRHNSEDCMLYHDYSDGTRLLCRTDIDQVLLAHQDRGELLALLTEETKRADAYKKAANERRTALTNYDIGWNDAMWFVSQSFRVVEEQSP